MQDVLIVVDADDSLTASSDVAQVAAALKQATLADVKDEVRVAVVTPAALTTVDNLAQHRICPLTLAIPDNLPFPGQAVYAACRDVVGMRQRLESWQYATGTGHVWLPIVLTAKGPLYGELIGPEAHATGYSQPFHLNDVWRQPLYAMAQRLLRSLAAPPAVYLMQVGIQDNTLYFDRLLPFPAMPAIASIGVQAPDLFACHWYCLTGKPIVDLLIQPTSVYQIYP